MKTECFDDEERKANEIFFVNLKKRVLTPTEDWIEETGEVGLQTWLFAVGNILLSAEVLGITKVGLETYLEQIRYGYDTLSAEMKKNAN